MLGLALLCGLTAGAARAADDAALQRCRAVSDSVVRLACYDALPLPAARTAPAAVPATPMTTSTAPAAPAAAQRFGQEGRDEPQAISSRINGSFEGWGPNSRIKLANGQVWQVVDGSEGVYFLQNPQGDGAGAR